MFIEAHDHDHHDFEQGNTLGDEIYRVRNQTLGDLRSTNEQLLREAQGVFNTYFRNKDTIEQLNRVFDVLTNAISELEQRLEENQQSLENMEKQYLHAQQQVERLQAEKFGEEQAARVHEENQKLYEHLNSSTTDVTDLEPELSDEDKVKLAEQYTSEEPEA